MVYTIKFNQDEPPSYNQATALHSNKTKEIQKTNAGRWARAKRFLFGGIIAFAFIGMFYRSLIVLHRVLKFT